MNLSPLATALFLFPGSFIVLIAQPSSAAEYEFDFVLDSFTSRTRDLMDVVDPDDDLVEETFTPGPLLLGSGFLTFNDDEVSGPLSNRLEATVPTLSLLGPSTQFELNVENPTDLNIPDVTTEDLQTPVGLRFSNLNQRAELTGLDFTAVAVNLGGGGRVTVIEAEGDEFSFRGGVAIPSDFFEGQAVGTGTIQFRQVRPFGETKPATVPEPATALGVFAAMATGVSLLTGQRPAR